MDNAAMIGIAAYYKYLKSEFTDPTTLDRNPKLGL
jgi:tRNA A37 threonylcarbamoyltransferase TsaD